MKNRETLLEFVMPYYVHKDIMHDLWHIELVEKKVRQILEMGCYQVEEEALLLAVWFHGFIYREENAIKEWMRCQRYSEETIKKTVQIAWESQRMEVPVSLEGKILHDAHVLEGGKTYQVVKTLITGSVRGQSLKETLDYMEKRVLDKNICYLPETIDMCKEMNRFTRAFWEELHLGIK